MGQDTDREYVNKVLGGDAEAFGWFIRRYGDGVMALVAGMVRCREDAQEITSDVFMKAYTQLHKFRGDSKFSTWLYRIAYNSAVSFARRRRIPLTVIDEEKAVETVGFHDEAALLEASLEQLESAMNKLRGEDRALLEMFYLGRMSVEEIASVTAYSPSNVKVKLHRTRKRLAEMIEKER